MIDDWILSLVYAAWIATSTVPLGLMLGSSCSPCCGCSVADGKPRTDAGTEGTWVPSGTWTSVGGVTYSFTANPGDDSGETWFFFGSFATSRVGGGANSAEQEDWGNICNWYSSKTTPPWDTTGLPAAFNKRATRLPPVGAVVHVYSPIGTHQVGPQTVKNIYFWRGAHTLGSTITTTQAAHDSAGGAFVATSNDGILHGAATFNPGQNSTTGIVNGPCAFVNGATNFGTVNDGATFFNAGFFGTGGGNVGTVNNGATFFDTCENVSTVNGGATFNNNTRNRGFGVVNGGAQFNHFARNEFSAAVNGGASFNDNAANISTVNGGASFNGNAFNAVSGTVNGGASFNGAACSQRAVGSFFFVPCTRKFVAHPTDLPNCNGTAPNGCFSSQTDCGCG